MSDNQYSHHPSTTIDSLITTIILNIVLFAIWMFIFERYRTYKQIYIKRLQPRFEEIGRVPPEPPSSLFGWFFAINTINELDVLRMVGLDAYMLLRYHVVCYKLALFLSFWGLLLLVPLYSTVAADSAWDRYTLSNVLAGQDSYKFRLWAAAIFGYVFSAYFCQLLFAEYSNFSIRRLQYLVQVDPDSPQTDPDTPPQKYFTVMVENIPAHLRSAKALEQFFDKLFPGEVYCVEVTLDLRELNALNYERKVIRDKLEKAIAFYEATNDRPETLIQPYGWPSIFGEHIERDPNEELTIQEFSYDCIRTLALSVVDPKEWGYVPVDALHYYTNKLNELNDKVKVLQQEKYNEIASEDKDLERKLRNRYDTRAAAAIQSAAQTAAKALGTTSNSSGGKKTTLDSILFGPPVQDYNKAAVSVMKKVDKQIEQLSPEIEKRRRSTKSTTNTTTTTPTDEDTETKDINTPEKNAIAANIFANDINTPLSPKSWMKAQEAIASSSAASSSSSSAAAEQETVKTVSQKSDIDDSMKTISAANRLFGEVTDNGHDDDDKVVLEVIKENDNDDNDEQHDIDTNLDFSQNSTFKEWAKSANIDLEGEFQATVVESRRRSQSSAPAPLPEYTATNADDVADGTRTRIVSWDASVDDHIIDEEVAPEERKDNDDGYDLQPIWTEKRKRRENEPDDDFMAIPLNVNDVVSEETIEQASKLAKMGIIHSTVPSLSLLTNTLL